ncbi:MAG: mercury resistance system transport protein MerF [Alphaproteobacteria bacterium]|nr:MAG: mercury resistance system transport protein MerF [Alphaproteobacteria bacterium]
MADKKLVAGGLLGTVLAAICCFTPALVLLLGALGLSAWVGWLDYVLFPALFLFAGLTIYGLLRRPGTGMAGSCAGSGEPENGRRC